MRTDADTDLRYADVAQRALRSWAAIFARPQQGQRQRDYAQALAWTQSAMTAMSGRGGGRFHFQTIQVSSRADPDQEFAESSRYWRLDLDGTALRLRRWRNHATLMGASQSMELDASAGAADLLPPELLDWWTSLQPALSDDRALHQAGGRDIGLRADAHPAPFREPRPAPADATAKPRGTDWRGLGVLALLIVVAAPMKVAVDISDGVRHAWQRLRGR